MRRSRAAFILSTTTEIGAIQIGMADAGSEYAQPFSPAVNRGNES